jgi:hypothetical protein
MVDAGHVREELEFVPDRLVETDELVRREQASSQPRPEEEPLRRRTSAAARDVEEDGDLPDRRLCRLCR